ncbi:MAG: glycogen synthase GlgA [Rhodobacteraceae bacterium]|nr:glycogen synthase GlgA [Paracoccaceae bacterium]
MTAVRDNTPLLDSCRTWAAGSPVAAGPSLEVARAANSRVLFASSEMFPLAKTGGLADVSAALPTALAGLGVDIRLVMPGYVEALDRTRHVGERIPLGDLNGLGIASLIPARMPDSGLPLWLVDCPPLFRRSGGIYVDDEGRDWPDNALRFALFCHAVRRIALGATGWRPEVVHLNDWHLGLVPALLAAQPNPRPATLLTIHNLAFQGVFPAEVFPHLGLPSEWFTTDGVEFYGGVSFLKAGIRFADRVTTVSPRYAGEILTPEFGCGLDGLLRARADDLVGILNGIDYDSWTPEDRAGLPHPYSVHDLSGKHLCKTALQNELGLEADPDVPVIAYISRLTEQKMADVLPQIGATIANEGAQLAICGDGDHSIEEALRTLEPRFPRRIAVRVGYEEAIARRFLAGADMLAAPARFEPCGLMQMYAMRFGTIPVVREIGGLADTVVGHQAHMQCNATGFVFQPPTAPALAEAIGRACALFREPVAWRAMQSRAMLHDFSWRRSAERYRSLYVELADRDDDGLATRGRTSASQLCLTAP